MKLNGKLLVVDDDEHVLLSARVVLGKIIEEIECLNSPARLQNLLQEKSFDVVLLDMNFAAGSTSGGEGLRWLRVILEESPGTEVIMMTAYGGINLAVKAMKAGAADFIVKPWENEKLAATVTAAFRLRASRREVDTLKNREKYLTETLNKTGEEMIGKSPAVENLFSVIDKVSATEANILLLGENGTGKELVAREIHRRSARSKGPFIHVDMGAVPEGLFEAEVFGHEKGAFTDAREQRIGRFELAGGGTLFLDEIGNLSLAMQAKLLTALQSRTVFRVGGKEPVPVDIRLISATNSSLKDMVSQNRFREDLLFRINTVEIQVPPLRERGEDIVLLATHFLKHFNKKYSRQKLGLARDAKRALMKYSWPGNVRELRHVIERAVIMCDRPEIGASDFMIQDQQGRMTASGESLNLEQIEKNAIEKALLKHQGNLSKAAKELGLGRTTLYRKMEKYDL